MKKYVFLIPIFLIPSLIYSQVEIDWSVDKEARCDSDLSQEKEIRISNMTDSIQLITIMGWANRKDTIPKSEWKDGHNLESKNFIFNPTNNLKKFGSQFPELKEANVVIHGIHEGHEKPFHITYALNKNDKRSPTDSESRITQKEVENEIKRISGGFAQDNFDKKNNIILTDKTLHIFLDQWGNTHFTGFPTTAREDFNYRIHFFTVNEGAPKEYTFSYTGDFDPVFDIYGAGFIKDIISAQGVDVDDQEKPDVVELLSEHEYGNIGPFTDNFVFEIKELGEESSIVTRRIKVAKVHHISVNIGLYGTGLRNPTNIEKYEVAPGDTTLIADDPSMRGVVTLMVAYYPSPRNLLYYPTKPIERLGFTVGTRLDRDQFENFFGGISYDIARGLALTAGAHLGRRNTVVGYDSFDFGEELYEGELKTKKEWGISYFLGLNIDLRVFKVLFMP